MKKWKSEKRSKIGPRGGSSGGSKSGRNRSKKGSKKGVFSGKTHAGFWPSMDKEPKFPVSARQIIYFLGGPRGGPRGPRRPEIVIFRVWGGLGGWLGFEGVWGVGWGLMVRLVGWLIRGGARSVLETPEKISLGNFFGPRVSPREQTRRTVCEPWAFVTPSDFHSTEMSGGARRLALFHRKSKKWWSRILTSGPPARFFFDAPGGAQKKTRFWRWATPASPIWAEHILRRKVAHLSPKTLAYVYARASSRRKRRWGEVKLRP